MDAEECLFGCDEPSPYSWGEGIVRSNQLHSYVETSAKVTLFRNFPMCKDWIWN